MTGPAGRALGRALRPRRWQDDNTVSEGQCSLPADRYGNGPAISVWVWAKGDAADQHRFIKQNMVADDCYLSGSRPSPWFADLNFSPGITGDIAGNTVGICRRVAIETHGADAPAKPSAGG